MTPFGSGLGGVTMSPRDRGCWVSGVTGSRGYGLTGGSRGHGVTGSGRGDRGTRGRRGHGTSQRHGATRGCTDVTGHAKGARKITGPSLPTTTIPLPP